MFHVEHEVQFMPRLAILGESALRNRDKVTGPHMPPEFLIELSRERVIAAFARFDVAPGEIEVPGRSVLAQEEPGASHQDAT